MSRWQGNTVDYGNYFACDWNVTSQNIAGNYSTISWVAFWAFNSSDSQLDNGFINLGDATRWSNGGRVYNYAGNFTTRNLVVASGSFNLGHNADGTKSLRIDGGLTPSGGARSSGGGNYALPTIPRQATMTAHPGSFTDMDSPWVEWANPGGFAVNVWLEIKGQRRFQANNVSSRYTWNFTDAQRNTLRGLIPNETSTPVRFVVETNVGGTYMTDYRDNTFSVINATPTFSDFTFSDSNSATLTITGNSQILIQNKSTLSAVVSSANKMVANKLATSVNYTGTLDGIVNTQVYSATTDVTFPFGAVLNPGERTVSIRANDSRGNNKTVSKTFTVIPYTSPDLNVTATRLNNFENATTIKTSGLFSRLTLATVDKNAITASSLKYRTRQDGGTWSAYTLIPFTQTAGTLTGTDQIISLINSSVFDIEVSVTDKLETVTEIVTVERGTPVVMISDNLEAVGINKMPDTGGRKGLYLLPTDNIWLQLYAVGDIFMTTNPTHPTDRFGGSWIAWSPGRTPVGVDVSQSEFNTLEKTGGAKTVALTEPQLPNIAGNWSLHGQENGTNFYTKSGYATGATHGAYKAPPGSTGGASSITSPGFNFGQNQAHNNLQPYTTCYMWKRTA